MVGVVVTAVAVGAASLVVSTVECMVVGFLATLIMLLAAIFGGAA